MSQENEVRDLMVRARVGDRMGLYFIVVGPEMVIGTGGTVSLILTADQTSRLYQDLRRARAAGVRAAPKEQP